MKERPILFSGPMVKAILEGRKTQTRRVIKTNKPGFEIVKFPFGGRWPIEVDEYGGHNNDYMQSKHGSLGDRLWVRETWKLWEDPDDGHDWVIYRSGGKMSFPNIQHLPMPMNAFSDKWRPSIHMFRWMSRITLEITDIRVERLQDISEQDAIAEGLSHDQSGWFVPGNAKTGAQTPVKCFEQLWDSINAKKHPWSSNPWVWVVEFKRVLDSGDGV